MRRSGTSRRLRGPLKSWVLSPKLCRQYKIMSPIFVKTALDLENRNIVLAIGKKYCGIAQDSVL